MIARMRVYVVIRRHIFIYISPREPAESDIPFLRFVDSVNTNAAVYNPTHERTADCYYDSAASGFVRLWPVI